MKLKLLYILFCFIILTQNKTYSASEVSISDLKEIILKKENDFKNLYVEGSYKVETWDKDIKEFVLSNSADIDGWLLNEPYQRYRFNVKNETCLWIGGAKPYSIDKYDKAFNGKLTQTLTKRARDMEDDVLSGEIDSVREPIHAIGNFATGWRMSIYCIYNNLNKSLSEMFDRPNIKYSAHEVNYEGHNCIKLTLSRNNGTTYSENIYFDAKKGYALVDVTPKNCTIAD